MATRGVDYYGIDELFSEEERIARDTVRAFVDEKILPRIGRHFLFRCSLGRRGRRPARRQQKHRDSASVVTAHSLHSFPPWRSAPA